MDTRLKNNLQEIENLLEDNLNLMIEIDNVIDKNEKQIDSIKKSSINVKNDNCQSYKFINRMNNFFYRLYTSLTNQKEVDNISIQNDKQEKNNNDVYKNSSKIDIMKKKSIEIRNKLSNQNKNITEINELMDNNNQEIKKNIILTDAI